MFPGGTPWGKRIPQGSMCPGGTRIRLFHPRVVAILPPVVATTNKAQTWKHCVQAEQGSKGSAGKVGGDVVLVRTFRPLH